MPPVYNYLENVPISQLEAGGTFYVKTANLHPDLTKRSKGCIGVITQEGLFEQGGAGILSSPEPEPQGPTALLILALRLLFLATFIVVISVVVSSSIVSVISDPVEVIARDSNGKPTLLRTRSGKVMTVGYDSQESAYIRDVEDPPGPLGLDLNLVIYAVVGLAILFVIVFLFTKVKLPAGGPKGKGKGQETTT